MLNEKIRQKVSECCDNIRAELRSKGSGWAGRSFTQIEDGVEYEIELKVRVRSV